MGNRTFLAEAYKFYKELFWDGPVDRPFGYEYDSVLCLNKMVNILGYPDDVVHWNTTVDWNYFEYWLKSEWERDTPGMFGDTKYGGMGWSNIAPAGISMFPRDWIDTMAN